MTKDELVNKAEYLVKYKEMFTDAEYAAEVVAIAEEYAREQKCEQCNVSGALPPVVEIEFGNHLYAKIDLQNGVKVLNVVNGWGDKVDLDLVKVKAAMTD